VNPEHVCRVHVNSLQQHAVERAERSHRGARSTWQPALRAADPPGGHLRKQHGGGLASGVQRSACEVLSSFILY